MADEPDEQRIPKDRFDQVNEQRKTAERERDELRQQIEQRDRQNLGDVERLKAEVEDLRRERDQAHADAAASKQARDDIERAGWVRAAAGRITLGEGDEKRTGAFHDPEDAVARINLTDLRTADAAAREVRALAERSAHLVRFEQPVEPPPASGADTLQRILDGGERVTNSDRAKDEPQALTAEQLNNLTTDQLVSLQESNPQLYAASLAAAASE